MDIRGLLSDPQFRLGLGLLGASGPMPANVGFGQRLMGAMGSFDEWDAQQKKMKLLEEEEKRRKTLADLQLKKILREQENEDEATRFMSDPRNLFQINQPQSAVGDYGPGEAPTVGPQETNVGQRNQRDIAMRMVLSGNPFLMKQGWEALNQKSTDRRFLPVGGNAVFDTATERFVPNTFSQEKAPTESEAERLIRRINDTSTSPSEIPMLRARLDAMNYKAPSSVAVQLQSREDAKGRVSENLQSLAGAYYDLDRLGAAVSNRKEPLDNIVASVRSSKPGQIVERAIGTQAQTVRDRINQMRPLLIQEIRQATQMGARGLDSNRELEFYLQAATDPSWSIESNIAAMSVLDKAYGLGLGIRASQSAVNELRNQFGSIAPAGDDGWSIRPKGK